MKVQTFKTKDQIWVDESGTEIPFNRVNKVERLMERSSAKILREALAVNSKLVAFRDTLETLSMEAYDSFMKSKKVDKKTKGNFTWHNFNRSIKIEVSISEPIKFDDLKIEAAREKFETFLKENIYGKNDFIKQMILDAFKTHHNAKLDTKRVLGLLRYESKINNPLFSEAVKLIQEAITRPKSKTYYRVWVKDAAGQYKNIELNLSSL
jgi:Protein of unknown function (DUF3164)